MQPNKVIPPEVISPANGAKDSQQVGNGYIVQVEFALSTHIEISIYLFLIFFWDQIVFEMSKYVLYARLSHTKLDVISH